MEIHRDDEPSFAGGFLRSFFDLRSYPALARRSGWLALAHFALLIVLMSAAYAAMLDYVMIREIERYLPGVLEKIPDIRVVNGKVQTDVPQPYKLDVEGHVFFVLDTAEPRKHVEQYSEVIVLGEKSLYVKEASGEIREWPLEGSYEFDAQLVESWYRAAKPWFLPVAAVAVGAWQWMWKGFQALVAAGFLALVLSGKPGFSTCWKLTVYALAPAMLWGLVVFAIGLGGGQVPLASMVFYGLLLGIPGWAAQQIRRSEEGPAYH
ncbi:MAG: DUF1189 family protein [Armatimonadetes bacterium]|nr:DUF1189 family protein [Armatimonadota bacterium]